MFGLLGLGVRVSLVSDLLRTLFFIIDSLIYLLIPALFSIIEQLYDITDVLTSASNVIKTFAKTIYGFLAIFMFFKLAFSLLEMLVDPSKIEDKQKGAGKIVTNVMITLILIVAVPIIFEQAREIQKKVIEGKMIERVIYGDMDTTCTYSKDCANLGDHLAKGVFSVFFRASSQIGSDSNTIAAWDGFFDNDNTQMSGIGVMADYVNEKTGGKNGVLDNVPVIGGIKSWITGEHYDISYIYILSTIIGLYMAWTIIKLAIDVAYRSLKFFALELIAPIPIMTYIDPKSSGKDGIFSKWVSETIKTYISLFIRIFVLAFVSILLLNIELPKDDGMFSGNGTKILIYILAIISFIKVAPKFIDGIFGTTLSKDSDTKFGSDLLKGALGAGTSAAIGGISGAIVAGPKNRVGGAWHGIKGGFSKGWNSAKKGDALGYAKGVYSSGTSEDVRKFYGLPTVEEQKKADVRNTEVDKMKPVVSAGKIAKKNAISNAEANGNAAIIAEFTRSNREINGFKTRFDNLVGDPDAQGQYKKFAAIVAENSIIPGVSNEGKQAYGHAAYAKMVSNLTKIQSTRANTEFETKYSAFIQRDSAGKNMDITEMFNAENVRRTTAGEVTYDNWQEMFANIGDVDPTTITVDTAYKVALDNKIKVDTGHTTSEWTNISNKAESDAGAAADNVKEHEKTRIGLEDKRLKEIYGAAKGRVEAEGFNSNP